MTKKLVLVIFSLAALRLVRAFGPLPYSHHHPLPYHHAHPHHAAVEVVPSCGCNDAWRSYGSGIGGPIGGGVVGPVFGGGVGFGGPAPGCVVVQPVATPGRIIVQEGPSVVPEYVESQPIVLQQEAAPRFVFGDNTPVRLSHQSRPSVIEHFETPYIIDAVQKTAFINHAAQPVIIDHYEHPEVIRDEGLPVIYEACDCGVPTCTGGCGASAPCPAPCH